ncbi:MAG TPA: CHAT domain-containing protein [Jatrophihabitans sp.]|nr:CHAT domain-containing protein [Jatrophihabitans sp.]
MRYQSALEQARELHRRGVTSYDRGRPSAAAAQFRRALTCLGARDGTEEAVLPAGDKPDAERHELLTRVLISLALSEADISHVDRGLSILNHATALAERSPELSVLALAQKALLLLRAGRFGEALTLFDSAVELLAHAETVDQCRILLNRGALLLGSKDLGRAAADLRRSAELAQEAGLGVIEYKALHNLGYLEFLHGNLPTALRLMAEPGGTADRPLATPLLDRARVLIEAGLLTEADRALAGAIEILRKDRMTQEVGESELLRAQCALALGEPALARTHVRRARTRFRRRGNRNWELVADLQLLQIELLDGAVPATALGRAERLRTELGRIGMSEPARTAALVAAEAALRAPAAAARTPGSAPARIPRLRPDDSIALRVHTQAVRAEAALRAGSPAVARRQLRAGLKELAAFRASFGSIELQVASAVHGTRLTELDIRIALDRRDPAAVFDALERARAVSSRIRAVTPKAEQSTADLLSDLRYLTEQLREVPFEASSRGRVSELRARIAELQDQLRMQRWHTEGTGAAEQPARLAAVQAELGADAALVSFVRAGGALLALRTDGRQSRMIDLGPAAELAERARRLRSDLDVAAFGELPVALRQTIERSVVRSLAELTRLLAPVLEPAPARLVVVPVGELWGVPWNALAPLRRVPVVVAPSASAWLSARAPRPGPGAPRVRGGVPRVRGLSGPGLTRARQEVLDLRLAWPAAEVVPEAGRPDLVAALDGATVLHIAAHGSHHPESPLFSSLQLHDGPAFAYELDAARETPEHVILSSCELGMNRISAGDEALGLTSVLLRRGARSVVASTVRVPDDTAAEFMLRYHRQLAGGRDSAAALALAADELGPFPIPFVCFGSAWRAAC